MLTSIDDYNKSIVPVIEEYFSTGSTGDVDFAVSDLRDLGYGECHHYFVKKLISAAMDSHDKEKEIASVLLSALYVDVISSDQISRVSHAPGVC